VDIPSGLDNRGTTILPFSLTVNFDPLASIADATTGLMNGGVVFSPAQTWATVALAASPVAYSNLQATDMSSGPGAVTATAPWQTRQTVLAFSGQEGCPPAAVNREITLNQTNYAIVPSSTSPALRSTAQQSLDILSNARWQAAAATGTVPYTDILSSYTTAPTGNEKSDGSYDTNTFEYSSTNPVIPNKKYETAQITFSDVEGRAKPVTITVMQCLGTADMSSVTTDAGNTDTSQIPAPASWAGKVVRHAAKSGFYEEFYSAEFGAAGRWMTTNLAARKYDGINHSTDPLGTATGGIGTPRTLTGPNANADSGGAKVNNSAYWCYPKPAGAVTAGEPAPANWNSQQGLLYTWDAATAGKGGAYGYGNTADEGNTDHASVQGICPAGWHLPSDREWNKLEEVIYNNPENYSGYPDNSTFPGNVWDPAWNTTNPGDDPSVMNYRPSSTATNAHGRAMKDMCGINGANQNGLSKPLASGGFSVVVMGYGRDGSTGSFGYSTCFWSSSSYGTPTTLGSWYHYLNISTAAMVRSTGNRADMFSVRCKKD
jgi:uncharacterized protein (TIGR02145 family)